VARPAIQLAVQLLAVGREILLACSAGKVEGVELLLLDDEHFVGVGDGLLAAVAHVLCPLELALLDQLKTLLAVRPSQTLHKRRATERLAALVAREVLCCCFWGVIYIFRDGLTSGCHFMSSAVTLLVVIVSPQRAQRAPNSAW